MIRFFKGTGLGPVLLLAVMALALWMELFLAPPDVTYHLGGEPMPLWGLIFKALSGLPLLAVILSFLLMAVMAIMMIRFNTSIFFIPRRTYFPALFYILLYSALPGEMALNPALAAALLIMAGVWRMVSAYRLNGMTFNFFDSALLISTAGLFYAGAIWFVLLVLVGALILRTPDVREISLAIVGAILPWIVLYAVWYLTGGSLAGLTEIIRHNLFDPMPAVSWSRSVIILLAVIVLSFLPGLLSLVREMPTQKIRSRKSFELLLWMMLICVATYFILPAITLEMNAITAIPVSFIMANYAAFTRRLVAAEVMFWMMAVMIVIVRLWP